MRNTFSLPFALAALLLAQPIVTGPIASGEDSWPQWRGAAQNGVASGKEFPLQWNEKSGLGIAWNIDLAGRGGSTPVVSGSSTYLTSGVNGRNLLMAFDTASGKLQWQVDLGEDRGNKHKKGSGSNPSAVVDGDSLFAYFRSGDLACVDTSGNVRWRTNLQQRFGEDTLWWDLGSSPTVTDSAVVVAVMQTGPSYLIALNKESGDLLWKTDRMLGAPEEAAQSYITPLVVKVDGQDVIAVMGADHLTLHAADSGEEIGRLGGFNPDGERFFRSIASPVAEGNLIVCPYARGGTMTAVRMDQLIAGKGSDAIAWFRDDLGSDVPTPAAVDGRVYVVGDKAKPSEVVHCLDISTGKTLWKTQLPESRIGFTSSPLVAGNHLYVTDESGTTYVIGPLSSSQPEIVSVNVLAESNPTVASPVPVGGDGLLLRTRDRLYRIGAK